MQRNPVLDGWRGVAILMVLVGHFSPAFFRGVPTWIARIGQHGVAIFFVLSGYLITRLLIEEQERHGTVDLRRFYIRRFFRLAPCAWIYLGAVVFLSHWSSQKPFALSEIFGSVFLFRNYVNFTADHLITAHFWSLSIEEQFYLLWPALLLFLGVRRSRWLAIVAACIIAWWRFQHWAAVSHMAFKMSTVTQYRADALFVGCALALTLPNFKNYLRAWMALPFLLYLVACCHPYPDMIPLHESIVIALMLAVTSQLPNAALFRVLNFRPLVFLGAISYSLYVWQEIFVILAGYGRMNTIVALASLSLTSLASYYLIERPMIQLGRHVGVERRSGIPNDPLTVTMT